MTVTLIHLHKLHIAPHLLVAHVRGGLIASSVTHSHVLHGWLGPVEDTVLVARHTLPVDNVAKALVAQKRLEALDIIVLGHCVAIDSTLLTEIEFNYKSI